MSHEMSYMGPRAFNHDRDDDAAEVEYDRLRNLARQEASKRNSCFQQSQEAYSSGDGARAKELSEQGKAHGRKMDEYNKQASEFIFRENNANGRVPEDTIDLHGQFVEEAEEILEERIKYAKAHGQTHLHVIVGKGNHSANHVQKIKPRVEQVCRELGLQYATEENAGRIYVNLTGGPADMPPSSGHGQGQGQGHGYGHGQAPTSGQYPGQQQPHHQQQQGGQQNEIEQVVNAILPRVLRKLEKACCTIM
ncbi:Smr domain-containing protein [Aspergillus clavatus NRRL 1]|uniref:Smr domain protein n=1 Tax=Aspergillus clavatus (strain ATCC 1007 / CBS 513.65 / DSM 816 / NCTC 3887 / NRRL 1 / QM 1276 / 107) TaxID=344612 RepID=A1CPE7_ASPCL|nr:Smr domain protein [Aspergillus clavatus NRRL 1]EAW07518.1 Smr domain protein [Aspergillus clavatus NRRL 1]